MNQLRVHKIFSFHRPNTRYLPNSYETHMDCKQRLYRTRQKNKNGINDHRPKSPWGSSTGVSVLDYRRSRARLVSEYQRLVWAVECMLEVWRAWWQMDRLSKADECQCVEVGEERD